MFLENLVLQISLALTAIFANMLSAFSGGGAGLVQLPVLILIGLPFSKALATHKIASVALGCGASLRYIKEKNLSISLSLLILACGLPGVFLGANLILYIPEQSATLSLGLLTVGLGIYSLKKPDLGTENIPINKNARDLLIGGLVLFAIGVLNGSLSSGTGLFVTLWLVKWFGLGFTNAIAHTLVLVGIFWNSSGALLLGLNGEIKWSWLPMLLGGSLIGGYLGSHLSLKTGNKLVKKAFELISLTMGSLLFIKGIFTY